MNGKLFLVSLTLASMTTTLLAQQPETQLEEAQKLADEGWPREKVIGETRYTIYQPQLDSWDGYELEGYAAFSVIGSEEDSPTYGVFWMSAVTLVDKDNRLVRLNGLNVTRVVFPSAPEREEKYLHAIKEYLLETTRVIALDRLEAGLDVLEAEKRARTFELKNDPPSILFSDSPVLRTLYQTWCCANFVGLRSETRSGGCVAQKGSPPNPKLEARNSKQISSSNI